MIQDCSKGNHSLIKIYEDGSDMESNVVRWCIVCGAVSIDKDFDGRTNPGYIEPMRFPEIIKTVKIPKSNG